MHCYLNFKRYGWVGVQNFIFIKLGIAHPKLSAAPFLPPTPIFYLAWYQRFGVLDEQALIKLEKYNEKLAYKPLISITMPVYKSNLNYLQQAIESVRQQIYPQWELCIVDDGSDDAAIKKLLTTYQAQDARIKVHFSEHNENVSLATNKAIAMASGVYIAFMDHDDKLTPDALLVMAQYINRFPQAKLFFSDEDLVTIEDEPFIPMLKPGWNPFLLETCNYICHLSVMEINFLRELGGLHPGFEGAQDYDLMLRATEKLPVQDIVHVPYILYHWRMVAESLGKQSATPNKGIRALQEHFDRLQVSVTISTQKILETLYRVNYQLPQPQPTVSIIIPTRDHSEILKKCIDSIFEKTDYLNYEIIIIDNGSVKKKTLEYFNVLKQHSNIKIIRLDIPFNHSILNNEGAKYSTADFLCLLNNDIEVIAPNWLSEMVGVGLRDKVAAVGAKLLYPDNTIQHAGVVMGLKNGPAHVMCKEEGNSTGYLSNLVSTMNYQAVTAACLLIRRSIFEEIGGFNPEFATHFNDVDFCIRLVKKGYQNVFTPHALLYHYESLSRGRFKKLAQIKEAYQRVAELEKIHPGMITHDPYLNPKFSRDSTMLMLDNQLTK